MTRLACAAILAMLPACATQPTAPRVVTQRVEIPVPQPVEAPARLKECGRVLPIPEFGAAPADADYVLTMDKPNAQKLQQLGDTLAGCLRAWGVWEREQRARALIKDHRPWTTE